MKSFVLCHFDSLKYVDCVGLVLDRSFLSREVWSLLIQYACRMTSLLRDNNVCGWATYYITCLQNFAHSCSSSIRRHKRDWTSSLENGNGGGFKGCVWIPFPPPARFFLFVCSNTRQTYIISRSLLWGLWVLTLIITFSVSSHPMAMCCQLGF